MNMPDASAAISEQSVFNIDKCANKQRLEVGDIMERIVDSAILRAPPPTPMLQDAASQPEWHPGNLTPMLNDVIDDRQRAPWEETLASQQQYKQPLQAAVQAPAAVQAAPSSSNAVVAMSTPLQTGFDQTQQWSAMFAEAPLTPNGAGRVPAAYLAARNVFCASPLTSNGAGKFAGSAPMTPSSVAPTVLEPPSVISEDDLENLEPGSNEQQHGHWMVSG